jgi:H+-translocating NAD(P) transhydrogenase subunit beta
MLDVRESIIAVAYIISAVLFIFGLKRLSSPATARSGNQLAAFGMVLALAVTLLDRQIISFWTIGMGMLLGAAIGTYFARTVQMTAMPQMVALFNGMGGATAALVSVAEFVRLASRGEFVGRGEKTSIVLGTIIGAISFTGSLIAFGKLQEILPGKPIQFPLQRLLNGLLLARAVPPGYGACSRSRFFSESCSSSRLAVATCRW